MRTSLCSYLAKKTLRAPLRSGATSATGSIRCVEPTECAPPGLVEALEEAVRSHGEEVLEERTLEKVAAKRAKELAERTEEVVGDLDRFLGGYR